MKGSRFGNTMYVDGNILYVAAPYSYNSEGTVRLGGSIYQFNFN